MSVTEGPDELSDLWQAFSNLRIVWSVHPRALQLRGS
jgi:hypothetical protein